MPPNTQKNDRKLSFCDHHSQHQILTLTLGGESLTTNRICNLREAPQGALFYIKRTTLTSHWRKLVGRSSEQRAPSSEIRHPRQGAENSASCAVLLPQVHHLGGSRVILTWREQRMHPHGDDTPTRGHGRQRLRKCPGQHS